MYSSGVRPVARRPVTRLEDRGAPDHADPAEQDAAHRRDEQGGQRVPGGPPGRCRPQRADRGADPAGGQICRGHDVKVQGHPAQSLSGCPALRVRKSPPRTGCAPQRHRRRALARVVVHDRDTRTDQDATDRTTAVSDLTFTVRPGVVTGFLGPNGAGKSHHHADDPRPGRADQRLGPGQRPSAPEPRRAAARDRRDAGPAGGPPVPQRLPPPARARADLRHPPVPGR